MANYITHHTKRDAFLKRKEATLRRLIDSQADEGRLFLAAEAVKAARIAALRSKQANRAPRESDAKIEALIDALRDSSADSIIAEYKRS